MEKLTLKERLKRLWKLNNSPREIALGVAIGVFIAITPLYGLHTVMVIVAALLIKNVNKIAIFFGTNISMTLTFPFITWAGYSIGRMVLDSNLPALQWNTFKHFSYKTLLPHYYPLFIGSVILGLLLAVIFYFLTLWPVVYRRNTKLKSRQK